MHYLLLVYNLRATMLVKNVDFGLLRSSCSKIIPHLYYSSISGEQLDIQYKKNVNNYDLLSESSLLLRKSNKDLFNDQLFNFYTVKSITPKANYITLSPYYKLILMYNNIFELQPARNQYSLFCKNVLLKKILEEDYQNVFKNILDELILPETLFKRALTRLQDNLTFFSNVFEVNSYIENFIKRSNFNTKNNYLEKLLHVTDEERFVKEMPFLNDLYNIINLYKEISTNNITNDNKFVIFNVDESLINDLRNNTKLIINKKEYNVTVEGFYDDNKNSKDILFDVRGDDNKYAFVFDRDQLRQGDINKLKITISNGKESESEVVDVPGCLINEGVSNAITFFSE